MTRDIDPRPGGWMLAVLLLTPAGGCSSEAPAPAVRQAPVPVPADQEIRSALPAQRPDRLEIELRRRTEEGDDLVLKLTPAGARYGASHGKARVALSYRLAPGALDEVYAVLREQAVDLITTEPRDGARPEGTSLRIQAGPARYSVSAMGRQEPSAEHVEAYAACVEAVEAQLPKGQGQGPNGAVVELRWDQSVDERAAALDLDVGSGFAGLHRVSKGDEPPRWALHLEQPRALPVQLRSGSPPRATTVTVPAGGGAEVVLDPEADTVVLRATEPGHPIPWPVAIP